MFTRTDPKLTGTCALLAGALSLVMIPLYFIYQGPPPADNVLIRDLMTVIIFTVFLLFISGVSGVGHREPGVHPFGVLRDGPGELLRRQRLGKYRQHRRIVHALDRNTRPHDPAHPARFYR
jgi:hypothetical protein